MPAAFRRLLVLASLARDAVDEAVLPRDRKPASGPFKGSGLPMLAKGCRRASSIRALMRLRTSWSSAARWR